MEKQILEILTSPTYRSVSSKTSALAALFTSLTSSHESTISSLLEERSSLQTAFKTIVSALNSSSSSSSSSSPDLSVLASLATPISPPTSPTKLSSSPSPLSFSFSASSQAAVSTLDVATAAGLGLPVGDGGPESGPTGLHFLLAALLASDQAALASSARDVGVFDVVAYYTGGAHLDLRAYEGRMDVLPVSEIFARVYYNAVVSSQLDEEGVAVIVDELEAISPVRALLARAGVDVESAFSVLSPDQEIAFVTSAPPIARHEIPITVHAKASNGATDVSVTYTPFKIHGGGDHTPELDKTHLRPLQLALIGLIGSDHAQILASSVQLGLDVTHVSFKVSAALVRSTRGILSFARVRVQVSVEFVSTDAAAGDDPALLDPDTALDLLRGEVAKRSPVRLLFAKAGIALPSVWIHQKPSPASLERAARAKPQRESSRILDLSSSSVDASLQHMSPSARLRASQAKKSPSAKKKSTPPAVGRSDSFDKGYDPFSMADAEVRREIHQAFVRCDTDGSSFIDRSEFRQLAFMMGTLLTEEELDTALAALDLDGDGKISESEFSKWWMSGDRGILGGANSISKTKVDALRLKLRSQVAVANSAFMLRQIKSAASELSMERAATAKTRGDDKVVFHTTVEAGDMEADGPPLGQRTRIEAHLVTEPSKIAPHSSESSGTGACIELELSVRTGIRQDRAAKLARELGELLAMAMLQFDDTGDPSVVLCNSERAASGLVVKVSLDLPASFNSLGVLAFLVEQMKVEQLEGFVEHSQRPGGPKTQPCIRAGLDLIASDLILQLVSRFLKTDSSSKTMASIIQALSHADINSHIVLESPTELAALIPLPDGVDSDNESDYDSDSDVEERGGGSNHGGKAGRLRAHLKDSNKLLQLKAALESRNIWASVGELVLPLFEKLNTFAQRLKKTGSGEVEKDGEHEEEEEEESLVGAMADAVFEMRELIQGVVAATIVVSPSAMIEVSCQNVDVFDLIPTKTRLREYQEAKKNKAVARMHGRGGDSGGETPGVDDESIYWGSYGVRSIKVTVLGAGSLSSEFVSRVAEGRPTAGGRTKLSLAVDGEPVDVKVWETPSTLGPSGERERAMIAIGTDVWLVLVDPSDPTSLDAVSALYLSLVSNAGGTSAIPHAPLVIYPIVSSDGGGGGGGGGGGVSKKVLAAEAKDLGAVKILSDTLPPLSALKSSVSCALTPSS